MSWWKMWRREQRDRERQAREREARMAREAREQSERRLRETQQQWGEVSAAAEVLADTHDQLAWAITQSMRRRR